MLLRTTLICVALSVSLSHVTSQNTKVSVPKPDSTPKEPSFLDQLSNLGKSLAAQAIGGVIQAGCQQCPRHCKLGGNWEFVCTFACGFCTRLVKRSVQQPNDPRGHLTPMPNKFSAYDLNDDGVVSQKELAFVAGQGTDIRMVFNIADKNGDGVLTPQELYEGPFVFEMDVSGTDYMHCQYMAKRMGRRGQSNTVN